ncbi:response regulator [Desulfococcaceae bacterium HSG8]|nr:response regulator [Desulfococcaceae bacterium HSG8]
MAKKILVIDDDPVIVKYLVNIFEDNGYETCTADDGVKALEVAKNEKPDLITLDLEMPEEWGTRFYRKLSKDSELKDIPVIVVSGMASRHLSIKKAVAYLSKPFDPDKLLVVVKKALA